MNSDLDRRTILAATTLAAGSSNVAAADSAEKYRPPFGEEIPVVLPVTELVWEALVGIAPAMDLGDSPLGGRRMVPITGGTFEGPRLRGKVLAGGADRQLIRKDGITVLDALYEMQTDDGAVITVRNHVTVDRTADGGPYRRSVVEVTAPEGPHGWLNRAVFVGTLHSLPPERKSVLIRVYRLI